MCVRVRLLQTPLVILCRSYSDNQRGIKGRNQTFLVFIWKKDASSIKAIFISVVISSQIITYCNVMQYMCLLLISNASIISSRKNNSATDIIPNGLTYIHRKVFNFISILPLFVSDCIFGDHRSFTFMACFTLCVISFVSDNFTWMVGDYDDGLLWFIHYDCMLSYESFSLIRKEHRKHTQTIIITQVYNTTKESTLFFCSYYFFSLSSLLLTCDATLLEGNTSFPVCLNN